MFKKMFKKNEKNDKRISNIKKDYDVINKNLITFTEKLVQNRN